MQTDAPHTAPRHADPAREQVATIERSGARQPDAQAFVRWGQLAVRAGDRGVGYWLFGEALEFDRTCVDAWLWRAGTAPRPVEAIECLEQVLRLDPTHARAQAGLAELRRRYGDPLVLASDSAGASVPTETAPAPLTPTAAELVAIEEQASTRLALGAPTTPVLVPRRQAPQRQLAKPRRSALAGLVGHPGGTWGRAARFVPVSLLLAMVMATSPWEARDWTAAVDSRPLPMPAEPLAPDFGSPFESASERVPHGEAIAAMAAGTSEAPDAPETPLIAAAADDGQLAEPAGATEPAELAEVMRLTDSVGVAENAVEIATDLVEAEAGDSVEVADGVIDAAEAAELAMIDEAGGVEPTELPAPLLVAELAAGEAPGDELALSAEADETSTGVGNPTDEGSEPAFNPWEVVALADGEQVTVLRVATPLQEVQAATGGAKGKGTSQDQADDPVIAREPAAPVEPSKDSSDEPARARPAPPANAPWVAVHRQTGLWSQPSGGERFRTVEPGAYFRIAQPQDGKRLYVFDPGTKNYAYIDAKDVGPAAEPKKPEQAAKPAAPVPPPGNSPWVAVHRQTALWSSSKGGERFRVVQPGDHFQVGGPQRDGRLFVWDPNAKNYAYIEADDVGPAAKPLPKPKEAPKDEPAAAQADGAPPRNVFWSGPARVSMYTCVELGGCNRTASGIWPYEGVVAVDRRVIPLGSKVWIEGLGTFLAADTGSAIFGNRIDVFVHDYRRAIQWGVRYLNAAAYRE